MIYYFRCKRRSMPFCRILPLCCVFLFAPEATMEDMIAFNLKFNAENGFPMGPQEEAERGMRQ